MDTITAPHSQAADPAASTPIGGRLRRLTGRLTGRCVELATGRGAIALFDQAVVSGTSFLTAVLIGRTGSKEELGLYSLAMSIMIFARGVQEQVVSAPYMVYCNRRDDRDLPAYTGSTLVHQLVWAALLTAGLALFAAALRWDFGPAGLGPVILALAAAAPFLLLRDYIRQLAYARFRLRSIVAADGAVALLQVAALVWLVRSRSLTAAAAVGVMGLACAPVCLGWFRWGAETFRVRRVQVKSDWLLNWGFGKWALASQLIGCAAPVVMPWVMALARDRAAVGVLAACTTLVGLANVFVLGVGNYLSPKAARAFAQGGLPRLCQVIRETALVFLVVLGAFCAVAVVGGDRLATLLYGPDFAGSGAVVAVLAFGVLVNSLGVTAGNGLWALERPSLNFRADVCSLVVTVVATAVGIPLLGIMGAAVATLAAALTGTVVRCLSLRRLMRELAEGSAQDPPQPIAEAL